MKFKYNLKQEKALDQNRKTQKRRMKRKTAMQHFIAKIPTINIYMNQWNYRDKIPLNTKNPKGLTQSN